jgi:hypothetical protein
MSFSIQDLMAGLPGSQPTNPLSPTVNPLIDPQINRKQLAGDVADVKDAKNQKLAMMLYALGGALKGDKNFVQNTIAIQQMQESKKKKEERERRYNEWIAGMNPESPLYQFSKMVGSEGIDKIAEAQFELATREPKEDTIADYKAYLGKKKKEGIPLTKEDKDLEAYVLNLSSFERYARDIGDDGQGNSETNPIILNSEEEAESYPKGTWVNVRGFTVQVD